MIMTHGNSDRVEAIFFEAIRHDTLESREIFLNRACADDAELRGEVDALLAAESSPDSFFDRPIDLPSTSAFGDAGPEVSEGQVIGRYKLLRQLGEGGFGVVYMAEQAAPIRRKVALKVIKPGMDSKEVVARFEAERQTLALMDHPHIAKVLDGGTTASGHPYFVMDLVKGVSLTEYCDANNVSMRDRLLLFIQVCQAVQHAHQKGIIHRDLKPANVMVTLHDGTPIPKVIDFGVSKAVSQQSTEKTLFTRYGQFVGTPQYMSPEQAEMSGLDVDTRSDIYSLGVLLYELLVGQLPFDSQDLLKIGFDDMRRLIREQEPQKPSTRLRTLDGETATVVASCRGMRRDALQRAVCGDLDWIVLKALEKDRNRRYESASSLVRDIERHLNNEPVNAGPPTFWYRWKKTIRRNRAATLAIGAVSLSLLLGICATSYAWSQAVTALIEKEIALAEKDSALVAEAEQRKTAQSNEQEAKLQAHNAQIAADNAEQSLKLVKSLLGQAGPSIARGKDATVIELLDSFAVNLDRDPPAKKEVELEVRFLLGEAFQSFSESEKANRQLAIVEQLGREAYEANSRQLAAHLHRLGKNAGSDRREKNLLEALRIAQTNEEMFATEIAVLCDLAELDKYEFHQDRERYFRMACDRVGQLDKESRARLQVNPYRKLVTFLRDRNRQQDADAMAQLAIDLGQEIDSGAEQVESLLVSEKFTKAYELAKKLEDGRLIAKTLAKLRDAERAKATSRADHRKLAMRLKEEIQLNWKQLHGAAPSWLLGTIIADLIQADLREDAQKMESLATTLAPHLTHSAFESAAYALRQSGALRDAERYYVKIAGHSEWDNAWRARCYSAARDFETASKYMELALPALEDEDGAHLWVKCELAVFTESLGRRETAKELFTECVTDFRELSDQTLQDTDTHLRGALYAIALISAAKADRWSELGADRVEALESALLEVFPRNAEEPTLSRMLAYAALGLVEEDRGNKKLAREYFAEANRCRPGTFEQMNGEWISDHVAALLVDAGELDLLEATLRSDVSRRDSTQWEFHPERAFVRIRLAEFLIKNNRQLDDAGRYLAEARQVYDYHGDWIPKREHERLDALISALDKNE